MSLEQKFEQALTEVNLTEFIKFNELKLTSQQLEDQIRIFWDEIKTGYIVSTSKSRSKSRRWPISNGAFLKIKITPFLVRIELLDKGTEDGL